MRNVYIIEEMAAIREPLAVCLRMAGFEVTPCADAIQALALIPKRRPDLIILDLAAPRSNGLNFLGIARSRFKLEDTPVVVLSASADRRLVAAAKRLGCRDYLLKSSFSLKELISILRKYLCGTPEVGPATTAAATPVPTAAVASRETSHPEPTLQVADRVADADIQPLLTREQCLQRAKESLADKTLGGEVAEVIAIATSPRGDLAQLAGVIGRDPVLSARVLQVANSAAYVSAKGGCANIAEAVRLLGCTTVRNLAVTMGVFDAMPVTERDGFNPMRSWQHSFAVAQLCERFLGEGHEKSAVAYLVGLCHDLGEILFRTRFAAEYEKVLEVSLKTGQPREQVEAKLLGMTHNELMTTIVQCMRLPESIIAPVEEFHRAGAGSMRDPIARVLRLADLYANAMLLASTPASMVSPLTQSECRSAIKEANPGVPQAAHFRNEIIALTCMLARLSAAEAREIAQPILAKAPARVWLARDPGLTRLDPLSLALAELADVQTYDHLPASCQRDQYDVLVVVARSANAGGFTPLEIRPCVQDPSQLLWLTAPGDDAGKTEPKPRRWNISLADLGSFLAARPASKLTAQLAA